MQQSAAFITVTNESLFPGTLATVNSIRHFHSQSPVFVVVEPARPLTDTQRDCFAADAGVRLIDASYWATDPQPASLSELKALACQRLGEEAPVVVSIDSDCLLCSDVSGEIERCHASQGFLGSRHGDGIAFDLTDARYGVEPTAGHRNAIETSCFFFASTAANRRVFERWRECLIEQRCGESRPQHDSTRLFNVALFVERRSQAVEILDDRLWSQSWGYWNTCVDFRDGLFVNCSMGNCRQRVMHSSGPDKFWLPEHRRRIFEQHSLQTYPYVWFLSMLWFGRCSRWQVDPYEFLPPPSRHLLGDLVHFLPQILQVFPAARSQWDKLTDALIDRVLQGVPRFMSLGGGNLSTLIDLIADHPRIRRVVEIGGYEAGSVLTLALRFANRDVDFYSVESFLGNLNGTMDGHPLPSRRRFVENLARFPTLRARLVPGASQSAAVLFDDRSLDLVFIDGCHESAAVLGDIEAWVSKIAPGGILAGDDFGWWTVSDAVYARFAKCEVQVSGPVWWVHDPKPASPAEKSCVKPE